MSTWGTGHTQKNEIQEASPAQVVYTFEDALRWMTQLAEGLVYLHACRPLIIHRDLKLENCLLTGAVLGQWVG